MAVLLLLVFAVSLFEAAGDCDRYTVTTKKVYCASCGCGYVQMTENDGSRSDCRGKCDSTCFKHFYEKKESCTALCTLFFFHDLPLKRLISNVDVATLESHCQESSRNACAVIESSRPPEQTVSSGPTADTITEESTCVCRESNSAEPTFSDSTMSFPVTSSSDCEASATTVYSDASCECPSSAPVAPATTVWLSSPCTSSAVDVGSTTRTCEIITTTVNLNMAATPSISPEATTLHEAPPPCPCLQTGNASSSVEEEQIRQLVSELSLERGNLSSARRKLTSAPDPRRSSKAIGSTVILILVAVFSPILIVDLIKIARDLYFGV